MTYKVNILSDDIHKRVLGRLPRKPFNHELRASQDEHKLHNLSDALDGQAIVNLPIPKGVADYQTVIDQAIAKYRSATLDTLETAFNIPVSYPKVQPKLVVGWQRLPHQGTQWQPCQAPEGTVMILDFESVDVNLAASFGEDNELEDTKPEWRPFIAVAIDQGYWYFWYADVYQELPTLASFGSRNMVIGHNVSYDRSFLATEYSYKPSGNFFFDTMSAWIAVRGFTNQQRSLVLADKDIASPLWLDETTTQSLKAVHSFYYPEATAMDKTSRDLWVKEGISYVKANIQDIVEYCFNDVVATLEVFRRVYPELKQAQPDVSMLGQLLLGNSWLPLSERWDSYYDNAEALSKATLDRIEKMLAEVALEVLENPTDYQKEALDWTPAKSGKAKGIPMWYRKCKGKPTIGSRLAVVLLSVTYLGETVKWQQETSNTGFFYTDSTGKLPHPDKVGKNLSSLFCKGNVRLFEDGVYKADTENAHKLVADKVSTLNWVSLKRRVAEVKVEQPEGYRVTLPQIAVTGTVTRRCADKVWMVASNAKKTRIGTELKSMVEAPEGYKIVGADIASEELWLASALGDMKLGFNGATALGLSVLIGEKDKQTDPHSLVAKEQGITRDLAKNVIYGLCYGLGLKGASDYLRKANLSLSQEQANNAAKALLEQVKGKISPIDRSFYDGMGSHAFNTMEQIASSPVPTTPILKAKISHCLRNHTDFKPTRTNWVIQSSGVDFRDLFMVYTQMFFDILKVDGKYMISIHDDFRYLVADASVKRAAYALQLAHLYTRAYIIDALGLDSLPAGACWFPEIEADTVLRKSTKETCETPSQKPLPTDGVVYTPQDILSWFNQA